MQQMKRVVFQNSCYCLFPDRVEQGNYIARALSRTELESNYPMSTPDNDDRSGVVRRWTLTEDIRRYPQLSSNNCLADALYNLALEELGKDVAASGMFDAGAKWPGVWTRDVSYSIILALASIEPEKARASLLYKVRRGRIVQDPGTGGSWPVSTDRLTWGLAAWEIYLTTGDKEWLQQSYPILRDSMLDDMQVVVNPATGLAYGESTFLDWRDQTYPQWMEPKDIYQSEALGTNVVFGRACSILGLMCAELHEPSEQWDAIANRASSAVNNLFWQEEAGFYGQYRYGGVMPSLSPRAEALGMSLAMLLDVASPARQDRILQAQPVMAFGVPTVFPQTPGLEPYHNDSVWPFVQAFWTMAAAKRANETAVLYGVASIQRAAALFLTNKENFVASTGAASGTAVNSDRQLWSVAASLAITYRVLFGMQFQQDGLYFAPVVPEAMAGDRTLTGFPYRSAVLDIRVSGFGSRVSLFLLDGNTTRPMLPGGLTGRHTVTIELANTPAPPLALCVVPATVAPDTPAVVHTEGLLHWEIVSGATAYNLYRNGVFLQQLSVRHFHPQDDQYTEYQVSAVNARQISSYLSKPIPVGSAPITIPVTDRVAYVEINQAETTGIAVTVNVPKGRYMVTFRYSNGAGPVNTNDCCAIRTLFLDGSPVGPVVMPQRGMNDWNNYGTSSLQVVELPRRTHILELRLGPADQNMSGEENRARIADLILTPLSGASP